MKASCRMDYEKIRKGKPAKVRLLVVIEAGEGAGTTSKPLNLALVLDHSGSMSGQKLQNVKSATKAMFRQLGREDILSLTIFDSFVTPIIQPVRMGRSNGIESVVDHITSGSRTFLSRGYEKGADFARQNLSDGYVTRLILLTDGLANEGVTDPASLAAIATDLQGEGVSTSTIGVGADYDEALLGKIAENGGGGAYFIERPEDATGVFQEELGYLKRLVATDCVVTFMPATQGLSYNQLNSYRLNDETQFLLGSFFTGQSRNLILELEVPAFSKCGPVTLGTVEVSWSDAATGGTGILRERIPVTIEVVTQQKFKSYEPVKSVILEAAFLTVARAKSEAMRLADQGKFDEAALLLKNTAVELANLNLRNEELNREIEDLRERAMRLKDDREVFFTPIEKKRMFHESDMMMKCQTDSYHLMKGRRKSTKT